MIWPSIPMLTLWLAACIAGAVGFSMLDQDTSTLVQTHAFQHRTMALSQDQGELSADETMITLVFALRMEPNDANDPKAGDGYTGPQIWHKDDSDIPIGKIARNKRSLARFVAAYNAVRVVDDKDYSQFEISWHDGQHNVDSVVTVAYTQYFMTVYMRKNSTMPASKCTVHFGEDRYQPTYLKTVTCPGLYELFADKFEDFVLLNDHKGGLVTLGKETCDRGGSRLHCVKWLSQSMEPDDPSVEVTAPEVHDVCWCAAWGDVHYECKCDPNSPKNGRRLSKFDYMGVGPHVLISMPKFVAQVFHCPLNNPKKKKPISIQVGFAAKIGTHTISFYEDIKIDDVVYVPDPEDGETILCVLRDGSTAVEAYMPVSDSCQARLEIYPKQTAGQKGNTAYSQQMVIVGPIMSQRELICSVTKRVFKNPARSPTGFVMDINCWMSEQALGESTGLMTARSLAEAPGKGFYAGGFDAGWFLGNFTEQTDMFTKCCDGYGEGTDNACSIAGPTEPLTLEEACAPTEECPNVGMQARAEGNCSQASDDPETIAQCALDFCLCCECEEYLASCENAESGSETEVTDLPNLPEDLPEVEDLPTTTTTTLTTTTTTTTTVTTTTTTTVTTITTTTTTTTTVTTTTTITTTTTTTITTTTTTITTTTTKTTTTTTTVTTTTTTTTLAPTTTTTTLAPTTTTLAPTTTTPSPTTPELVTTTTEMEPTTAAFPTTTVDHDDPNIAAVGDPHCVNVKGEGFDVHSRGQVTFVEVPRGNARGRDLVVKGLVEPVNAHPCSPTVITMVTVAGQWLGSAPPLTLVPGTVAAGVPEMPREWALWMASQESGNVSLQVKGNHPRMNLKLGGDKLQVNVKQRLGSRTGIQYLDLQIKGLKRLGDMAGGILGLDDHTTEEQVAHGCDPHAIVRLDRAQSEETAETGAMISQATVEG